MPPAVRLSQIHRRFGSVEAVKPLDLVVEQGEIFGLIGPDGAGKTTLLRLIAGILAPTSGSVEVFGLPPERNRPALGYLPQRFGLYEDLSLEENLAFYGRLYGLKRERVAERAGHLLTLTGLAEFRRQAAARLSGGMKQKLALAITLLHEPGLLLLDEPTTGVDPVFRRELWDLLYDQAGQGLTVIIATPYLDEADRCHRVGLLKEGRLNLIDRDSPPAGRWFSLAAGEDRRWPLWEWLRARPEVGEVHFAGQYLRGQLKPGVSWPDFSGAVQTAFPGQTVETAEPDLEDLYLLAAGGE